MKRFFLGAASAISSLEIIEVSITGKHFLYQNKSENHAVLQAFDIPFFFCRLLGDTDQCSDYFCMDIY